MQASEVAASLEAAAGRKKNSAELERFFKCGKGGYGEGDRFIGVVVPDQRKVAARFRLLPPVETAKLLASPIHEHRLTALFILVRQYKAAGSAGDTEADRLRGELVRFYLERLDRVNNWDLVDSSAPYILGPRLLDHPEEREVLRELAESGKLWRQRVAIMATFAFIRAGEFGPTMELADLLLDHPHDLIHKAAGWMLREIGNRNLEAEENFLRTRYRRMPRTMLRYAIEKFPEAKRKSYLTGSV